MRRKGVSPDQVPVPARWKDFLLAIDQCLDDYETNRTLLDRSAKTAASQLRELYDQLEAESTLRVAEIERHKKELESDVQSRTADLRNAQRELEQINIRLEHDATHDSLTGVHNRAYFLRELKIRYTQSEAVHWSDHLTLFFVDFDNFKRINDSLGHGVGDQVLVAFATRLRGVFPDGDCVARLGGDEFTVLKNLSDGTDEREIAARISNSLEEPFKIRGMDISIQASVGVATAKGYHRTAEGLMRDADIAMYRAKNTTAQFVVFDHALFNDVQESLTLERELKQALTEQQFSPSFQPIVDLETNLVCATETLVRWNHPERGTVQPIKFVQIAEETGSIVGIDRSMVEQTCSQFRSWLDRGIVAPQHKVNLNVSGSQLERADSIAFLLNTLGAYNIEPSQVVLEVLESHLLDDSWRASSNVFELSDLGFGIYIDDFGTGYSSLSYLAKYPIDGIKIDRVFVRDVETKPENRELIRSIVAMADALGVRVVVEGVETTEQLTLVHRLGCRFVQGFVYSKPLRAPSAERYLSASLSGIRNRPAFTW